MLATDNRHVILDDPGAVVASAARLGTQPATGADAAAQNGLAAEGEGGESGRRRILEPNFRRPILIDEDGFIKVAEAVVTQGEAILDG